MPVMRDICMDLPEQNLLAFLSFVTAADALKALDRLGPSINLDISVDGLRRLARLLNNDPAIDPLKYINDIDPALQKIFGIGLSNDTSRSMDNSGKIEFTLVRSAFAATSRDRLNRWVPTTAELASYLPEVRALLLEQADARIDGADLASPYVPLFRKLMLATAWQESCWRHYTVRNRKIVPLISASGDVGMLQINERVWRGFYSPAKLRWDIVYNTRAGSEILFKFLINYALKKKEHRQKGGLANLARASYSAYNGGPSKVSRYRRRNVPKAHRKIDLAFWEKYRQVDAGRELTVAKCWGGQVPKAKPAAPSPKTVKKTSLKRKTAAAPKVKRIENAAWIRSRPWGHFTLQLAAMRSEQAVLEVIRKQRQPGSYAYFARQQEGGRLHVAIYGSFASRREAEKSAASFAPLAPWVREFGSIQAVMLNRGKQVQK